MDEAVFYANFPGFPKTAEDIQKLGVLLRSKKIITKEEWDILRKDNPEPAQVLLGIAQRPQLTSKEMAEIEATLLDTVYVDLEGAQVPNDVIKMFKIDAIVEHKAIPIKLTGTDLLVGFVSPGNSESVKILSEAHPALAIRPAKILWDHLERKIKQLTEHKKPAATHKKGPRKRLGDILVESKYISDEQMKLAIDDSKKEKLRLGAYLVKKGLLSNKQLSIALSKQFDIEFVDLEETLVDPILGSLIPKKLCHDQILCPVKKEDGKLIVAMTDPTDIITIDHIEMMTGMRVSPVVSSELSIFAALGKLYGESVDALADQVGGVSNQEAGGDDMGGDFDENAAPIIKAVNLFITQAIQTGTSDIHIEPFENLVRVRFRKDGVMKMFKELGKAVHAGIVSRIKVMSNLDIAETRMPQDGRIKLTLQDKKIDLRVSCVPCAWGEKVCMRLLDQSNLRVNLGDLGFEPHVLDIFMSGIKQPNGIVLVTGPTGSGKTTTLYSSLFLLNNPAVNIMTAEDPVEYNLMGINQVQCHPDIGLDFSAALRSFLRQDPNIIMIGEIRDFETASIAIKAAMTGHLVISTLHTNDAPSTIARLINMGLEPFSITNSIRVVEAQRLVRKICKACITEYKPTDDLIKTLGINKALIDKLHLTDFDISNFHLAKGSGCPECDQTGYKGRQGIYEVLTMSMGFRDLVEKKANPEELRRQALKDGMVTLRESAIYKLLGKKTTVEEVIKTTMETGGQDDDSRPAKAVAKKVISIPREMPAGEFSVTGIEGLTQEIHAFRNSLDRLAGGSMSVVAIQNEILKKNLTDPLANIQTQIQSGISGTDMDKILPSIQAQSQRMGFNLKNLVTYFSNPPIKMVAVKINDLVEKEIVGNLKEHVVAARLLCGKREIGQGLKISKNLLQNLPLVAIDLDAFKLIASNIIVNALISMQKGGEIKLVTRLKPGDAKTVELIVFDNGAGISAEYQTRLFTPFLPLGRPTLGLGLSVVKKLLTACGGRIMVKSNPGTNTLVTMDLQSG